VKITDVKHLNFYCVYIRIGTNKL